MPKPATYSIIVESGGNARITDRDGNHVATLEDYVLYIDGVRIGEVNNYHEAMEMVRCNRQ